MGDVPYSIIKVLCYNTNAYNHIVPRGYLHLKFEFCLKSIAKSLVSVARRPYGRQCGQAVKNIMKAKLPQPVHESYLRHRKQVTWQIVLPVLLMVVLIIALVVLINIATFRDNGDVARWAAISTIWMVVPIMLGMLIFLVLLVGLIYLLSKLLGITPRYTGLAQDYVHKFAGAIKRGLDAIVKQFIEIQGVLASIREFFGRIRL